MTQKIPLLTALLIIQAIIAIALYAVNGSRDASFTPMQLLPFDKQQLNRIVIRGDSSKVELVKQQQHWLLAESDGVPIEQAKFNSMLNKLERLNTTWPVTTTTASHQRFEVADDNFRRKITFYDGQQQLAELFVGTSPGFKQSHLRLAGQDEVYALDFAAYEASATARAWLDKSVLSVPGLNRIKGNDFDLVKENEQWHWHSAPLDLDVDQQKAEALARAIANLKVTEYVKQPPDFEPDSAVELIAESDQSFTFELYQHDGDYYVTRADRPQVFKLTQTQYEQLSEPTLSNLAATSEEEPSATSDS
ncbi:hypothetical protein GCM10011369_31730 [Neiella marina]|uniref:DUF4340 domain-containing protein n=1 Tax=Neiella marina TaxID=508461 RepID=A0A8J2U9A7_9GAMM|nr:DUF4340 domain-containing protein [Neiella marina]GGA87308.1 hypothetical protein GCM10011369_31730 [Neiella marina]